MTQPLLECADLTTGYQSQALTHDFSLTIQAGEIHFLLGPNGSGKSTLLRTVAAVQRPLSGALYYRGSPLKIDAPFQARPLFLPSTIDIHEGVTALDLMDLFQIPVGALKSLSFQNTPNLHTPLNQMSSGECQRLLVSILILRDQPMALFDEPQNYLEWGASLELAEILELERKKGRSFLIATHDFNWALRFESAFAWILGNDHRCAMRGLLSTCVSSETFQNIFRLKTQLLRSPLGAHDIVAIAPLKTEKPYL